MDWRTVAAGHFATHVFRSTFAAREILWLQVGDVQKPVLANTEINERSLNSRLHICDYTFVNIPDMRCGALPFEEDLLKLAIAHDGDAALFALRNIDDHDPAGGSARCRILFPSPA